MRKTYGGYSITTLREEARKYKVPGRSRMGGWSLLAAVRGAWDAERREAEQALLAAVAVGPGVLLRHKSNGDVIRATSEVKTWEPYGSLYVEAEYVETDGWGPDRRAEHAAYLNKGDATRAQGDEPRHPLYQYEPVTS